MPRDVIEVEAPSHYASAIINGDRSGLNADDERELDLWLADFDRKYPGAYIVDVAEDTRFGVHYYEGEGRWLGTDLATYTALRDCNKPDSELREGYPNPAV